MSSSHLKNPVFQETIRTRFRQADPAGILFFAQVFKIAHDTYESFVEHLGFTYKEWFEHPEFAVPIRHTEADYIRPLRPSEEYDVQVFVDRIGKSSFTLKYIFVRDENTHCEVSLVHTFINKKLRSKAAIPARIREALETYQRECLNAE